MLHQRSPLLLCCLLSSCAGPTLADGKGEGLLSFDRVPPKGVTVYNKPVWTLGDRLVYRQGERVNFSFRVTEAGPDGYKMLEERLGMISIFDADFALKEKVFPKDPTARLVLDPAEHQLNWPLWVGKRWTSRYLEKRPGRPAPSQRARYHCDAEEWIQVPAGRFRCLRIWRRSTLEIPGQSYMDRTSIHWYAPEVGYFVRRLEDGILLELLEYHRQKSRG